MRSLDGIFINLGYDYAVYRSDVFLCESCFRCVRFVLFAPSLRSFLSKKYTRNKWIQPKVNVCLIIIH